LIPLFEVFFLSYIQILMTQFVSLLTTRICIVQDLQHFPRVDVKIKLQDELQEQSKPTLNIRAQLKNSRRSTSRAIAPRFPKVSN
jgi:hypothetical protein